MEWIWIAAIIVIALIVVIRNIRVVQQSQAYVIERLGAFSAVWGGQTGQPEGAGSGLSPPARYHQGQRHHAD